MSNMTRLGYRWQRSLTTSALGWMLIVGGAVVGAGLATPAVAQEPVLRVLTVTGRGREAVPTTLTQATLGVEVQGSSAEVVQTAVAERSDRLVQYLRSRNVDELETVGLRLNPQYDYRNGQARIIGYVGTNTVSFQIATAEAGELLDGAIAAGATQIQGIRFIAEDEALGVARQRALQAATADAQAQANAVLSYLNLGAEEIINIQINGARGPIAVPLPAEARLASAEADVSTPVIGGDQTVEATVTLQIRY
jgi:uncharacterized protein YggE